MHGNRHGACITKHMGKAWQEVWETHGRTYGTCMADVWYMHGKMYGACMARGMGYVWQRRKGNIWQTRMGNVWH